MTLDANPEYMYGTRGRKRRLPHEQFVYADVREGMGRGFTARWICEEYRDRLGMNLKQVERVMETIRANDYAGPRLHGVGRGWDKIGDAQMEFLLRWLEDTGARKTSEMMCQMLRIRFGINITASGIRRALHRYRISYKKLTQMDKRAFTPAVRVPPTRDARPREAIRREGQCACASETRAPRAFLDGGHLHDLPSPVQPVVHAHREGVPEHAHEV